MPHAQQWEILEDIIQLLKPIEYVTTELSAKKYSTASKVMPIIRGIYNATENIAPNTRPGLDLKTNIINNIEIRFNYIESNIVTTSATIMDPRFKTAIFQDDRSAHAAVNSLKSEITTVLNQQETQENRPALEEIINTDSGFWNFHVQKISHLTKQHCTTLQSATNILAQYLDLPYESMKSDPIDLWKKHELTMPQLQGISDKYLSVPATSVPSERIFSKAGQIMSERRN